MILKCFRQISTFFDIILMYKRMNWDADRRVAELREGRRTECVAQLARDQRSRFTEGFHLKEKEIQSNYMNNPDSNRELFPLETLMDLLLFSFYVKRI